MVFIFETKNISKETYVKIARRYVSIQFGFTTWQILMKSFDVYVVPVEDSDKYRTMYGLTKWDTNPNIPWGFTQPPNVVSNVEQKGRVFWFVNDTKNPFVVRQNAEKGLHEMAHAACWIIFGGERRTRLFDDPQARAGTTGATYVTLVHDVAYGFKELDTFWVRYGIIWLPIRGLSLYRHIPR
jgi:hypothetical protein